jgi:AGZA family xanthine/uracil permease-like MFS transporter
MDCTGTLFALCSSTGIIDKDGNFPRSRIAFSVDAIGAILGSVFGTSPVVAYIESAAGIEAGSRTGLTAVFCGFYFFIAIFFSPILSNIPPWATGGALILVGTLMARSLVHVHWENPTHAFIAFITVIVMPLTYSIAYGILAGICGWIILKVIYLILKFLFKIPDPSVIAFKDVETEIAKIDETKKSFYNPSEAIDTKKEDA